jgi:hypothetical protein
MDMKDHVQPDLASLKLTVRLEVAVLFLLSPKVTEREGV